MDFCCQANHKSGRPLSGEALPCDQCGFGRRMQ
jgi:hypothetical protein